MKRSRISLLALVLAVVMILPAFASCGKKGGTTTPTTAEKQTSTSENSESEKESGTIGESGSVYESDSANGTDSSKETESDLNEDSESGVKTEKVTNPPVEAPDLEGEYADIISVSNKYANNVNAFYSDSTRTKFVIENRNMVITNALSANDNKLVASIKNCKGESYVQNTMDVFVKMQDGGTYYTSKSLSAATINIDRFGYYYYQTTISGQNFTNNIVLNNELDLNVGIPDRAINMSEPITLDDGSVSTTVISSTDPQVQYINITPFAAADYNYIALTIKIDSKSDPQTIRGIAYVAAGSQTNFTSSQSESFKMIADGEFHTYYIRLDQLPDYTGNVTRIRFDLDGNPGDTFVIKDVKAVNASADGAPELVMRRTYNTYSDKNLQLIQVTAKLDTTGIEQIGMITDISSDTVEKIIVKDKTGLHTSFDGVDWATAEYVGFDIKNVGIFGYILLNDDTSGTIKVTLDNGVYRIVQSRAPEGNSLFVPNTESVNTKDFFMGQRIYTDELHDFDTFVNEAEIERNPLPAENIIVNTTVSDKGAYVGYNTLRGAYEFTLQDTGFNTAYFSEGNKHFNITFTVRGDDRERMIYMMAAVSSGQLECAAVLDGDRELLPVPVEVCKNFSDGDYSIHHIIDTTWSETFFPIPTKANSETDLVLLHMYQNWGRFPLKQISSIKFGCPYYHLSTGVTETNCIVPWFTTGGSRSITAFLPDHRAMSAPFWGAQPQHTSGGSHGFIEYTDSNGKYNAAENIKNNITAYGPTYAEVVMDYISDDGKIKVSYTHMEMPQTDENRGYYTITYEVLEDISFKNFKDDFTIYSVAPKSSVDYKNIGYLDEQNECKITLSNTKDRAKYYILGDNCPYFSYFRDDKCTASDGYVNLAFLIMNSNVIINGKEITPQFIISDLDERIRLSLNLEEVDLKAGDLIQLNAIIMPWGSQNSDYDSEEFAPDQNVRDVRKNSILNPLTLKADKDCTVVETPFLPRARSTNGKTAEFTLSGGNNNCTVKVDGFVNLTIPTVYELVDGEWVRYNLSSRYYPDKSGNKNRFDGYAVTYEDDGFYSYSFVVEMSQEADRSFKIVVDEKQFANEVRPPQSDSDDEGDGLVEGTNKLFDPTLIQAAVKNGRGSGEAKIMTDRFDFVRVYGDAKSQEAFFSIYQAVNDTEGTKTGQFFMLKYRVPSDKPEDDYFAIFSSSEEAFAKAEHAISYTKVKKDGEWHILLINLADAKPQVFLPADNGTYQAQYLRFDIFNATTAKTSYIDIAFMAFDDDFNEALSLVASDFETIDYFNGEHHVINTKDGVMPEKQPTDDTQPPVDSPEITYPEDEILNVYLHPTRLNKESTRFSKIEVSTDQSYISYYSEENAPESYIFIYNNTGKESGQYLIFKYRTTASNWFQFFTTTQSSLANASNVSLTQSNGMYINDGEWHVVVINLADALPSYYQARDDGKFYATAVRFDVFNSKIGSNDQVVDVAYIGLCNNFNTAIGFDDEVSSVIFYNGSTHTFDPTNAENAVEPEPPVSEEESSSSEESSFENEESSSEETESVFNVYYDAKALSSITGGAGMGEKKLSDDETYITYYSNETTAESYFTVFNNRDKSKVTGQYLIFKYKTTTVASNYFDFFTTTEERASGYNGSAHVYVSPKNGMYHSDDTWRVIIIDLAVAIPDYFTAEEDGTYKASYLRFDVFNATMGTTDQTVDVAYIGMDDSYDDVIGFDKTVSSVLFYNGTLQTIDVNNQ